MPLVTCPDCGRQVSDAAPSCPGCGRPMVAAASRPVTTATKEATWGEVLGFIAGAVGAGGRAVVGRVLAKPRRQRQVVAAAVACALVVVTTALVLVKRHDDERIAASNLALCHQWEKTLSDRIRAGLSTGRGALVSARVTCAASELKDTTVWAEENSRLLSLERSLMAQEAAPANEKPPGPVSTASAKAPATAEADSARDAGACDAEALWFGDSLPVGDRARAFTNLITTWTPECRYRALEAMCSPGGCDEVVTDKVIGAASANEKASLRGIRVTHNRAAVTVGRDLYGKVATLAAYARSIRGAPRGSAYNKRNATAEEMAEELAEGNPCLERMSTDFARIDEVEADIDQRLPRAPAGTLALKTVLAYVRSCVDCSDDRSSCGEIAEPLGDVRELMQSYDKLIASDRTGAKGDAPSTATSAPTAVRSAIKATVAAGAVQVNGRLSVDVVQGVVRKSFAGFRACYENGMRTNPNLAGRVTVKFVIDRSGSVATAQDGGSEMTDPTVVGCVVRGFGNLSFPQPEGGMVTVVYPIIFAQGG
jgi:hypothetical protein